MGRSVSHPAGAHVAFRIIDADDTDEWQFEYECLVDDIREQVRANFPSFDPVNGWRDREDRVLMRNSYADIGISTYGGVAAIWLAERIDQSYAYRAQWGGNAALARRWIDSVETRFLTLFGQLNRVGTFSNGESVYVLRDAA